MSSRQNTLKRQIILVTGATGDVGFGICHRLLFQLSQPNPPDAAPIAIFRSAETPSEHDAAFGSAPPPTTIIMACRNRARAETARTKLYALLKARISTLQKARRNIITHARPRFDVQNKGVLSGDNLGLVWQSNLFAHYVLFRCLEPLLAAYAQSSDPHSPNHASACSGYWQLVDTHFSYQASKFQIDLLALELAQRAQKTPSARGEIRHLLVTPGIVATNIAAGLMDRWGVALFFYSLLLLVARLCGLPHVSHSVYRAAAAVVHLSLADLAYIPGVATERTPPTMPKITTESVAALEITPWAEHPDEGALLLERCEGLYQTFLEAEAEPEEEA
ncbi:hypothetical protein B0H21DRAFT_766557, partial [Amylocystis lapponica]